jgi:hypothetical protein
MRRTSRQHLLAGDDTLGWLSANLVADSVAGASNSITRDIGHAAEYKTTQRAHGGSLARPDAGRPKLGPVLGLGCVSIPADYFMRHGGWDLESWQG